MEQKPKPKKVIDLRKRYFKKHEKDVVVVKFANGEYGLYFSANKRRILCNNGGHVFLDEYSENLITEKVFNPNYQIVEIWTGVEIYTFGIDFDPFKHLKQAYRIWEQNVLQDPVHKSQQ